MADIELNIVIKEDGSVALKKIEQGIKDVGQAAENAGKPLSTIFGGVGIGAGIAIYGKLEGAVKGVLGALPGMFSEFMRSADAMQTLSDRTGISAEALQAWEFAAAGANVSAQAIAQGFQTFQTKISGGSKETAESLKKLGLSMADLGRMTPDAQMSALVSKISSIQDPAQKSALAMNLLGKSGKQLVALGGDFEELSQKAREWGIVSSNEVIAAADDLGDSWGRLEMVIGGLKNNLVAFIVQSQPLHVFIEGLTEIFGELSAFVDENSEQFRKFVDEGVIFLSEALVGMVPIVKFVIEIFRFLLNTFVELKGGIQAWATITVHSFEAAKEAATGHFTTARELMKGMVQELDKITKETEASTKSNDKLFGTLQGGADKAGVALANLANKTAAAAGQQHKLADAGDRVNKTLSEQEKKAAAVAKLWEQRAQTIAMMQQVEDAMAAAAMENALAQSEAVKQVTQDINEETKAMQAANMGILDAGTSLNIFERNATAMGKALKTSGEALKKHFIDQFPELKGNEAAMDAIIARILKVKPAAEDAGNALEDMAHIFEILGISADSAIGQILGGLTTLKSGFTKMKADMSKMFSMGGASGLKGLGNLASNLVGGIGAALTAGKAVMQIGKAIHGLFSKSPVEKAAESAGKALGVKVSKELAQKIADSAKKLDIGMFEASLLHLGDAIAESGKKAAEFGKPINDLLNAIALGAVPAAEGIAEIGEVFGKLADEAQAAGTFIDQTMVDMIQRARELGLEVPEIKQFVKDALTTAAEGISGVINNLKVKTAADAKSQAYIFSAWFWATVREDGIVAAGKAGADMLKALSENMKKAGIDPAVTEAILGPIRNIVNLVTSEKTKPIVEGIEALDKALQGLAQSGYITEGALKGVEQQAATAFQKLIDSGVAAPDALQAIAPLLAHLKEAAEKYGVQLDENTQSLIRQAEEAGIAFPTDPAQAMLEVLTAIAEVLGADIPESAKRAADAMRKIPPPPAMPGPPAGGGGGGYPKYQHGGVAKFTGPAILHGSITRPEYIFNSDQMKAMLQGIPGGGFAGRGGGSSSTQIMVDARGASNPREIEEAARRGVRSALERGTDPHLKTAIREAAQ